MSKEFEEWLNDPEGDWYGTHEYGTAGQCAADAWHYQQKKIDELEGKLGKITPVLNSAVKVMEYYHRNTGIHPMLDDFASQWLEINEETLAEIEGE